MAITVDVLSRSIKKKKIVVLNLQIGSLYKLFQSIIFLKSIFENVISTFKTTFVLLLLERFLCFLIF